uniref:Uncharacterized protein n=1 Tax=Arundo donax TaxID=35708 RepID=A0A0A9DMI1_ARUDO
MAICHNPSASVMDNLERTALNSSNRELKFSLLKDELPVAVANEFISIEALRLHSFAAFDRGPLQSFSTRFLASSDFSSFKQSNTYWQARSSLRHPHDSAFSYTFSMDEVNSEASNLASWNNAIEFSLSGYRTSIQNSAYREYILEVGNLLTASSNTSIDLFNLFDKASFLFGLLELVKPLS